MLPLSSTLKLPRPPDGPTTLLFSLLFFVRFVLKVPGWIEQLTGLGDRLFESKDVPAAHALFLVAGMQVELPTTKGSKFVLPGVDHRSPAHRWIFLRCSLGSGLCDSRM